MRAIFSYFSLNAARYGGRVRLVAALMAAASLIGCGGLGSPSLDGAFEQVSEVAPEPLPPYRKLIAASLKTFKQQGDLHDLEISDPRWIDHTGGSAWLVCVKLKSDLRPLHYAFFIRNGAVIETRFAVGTDRCGQRNFEKFDLDTAK